ANSTPLVTATAPVSIPPLGSASTTSRTWCLAGSGRSGAIGSGGGGAVGGDLLGGRPRPQNSSAGGIAAAVLIVAAASGQAAGLVRRAGGGSGRSSGDNGAMAAEYSNTEAFRGARFTGADLTGARFRDCNLHQVKIVDSFLTDVNVS